MRPSSALPVLAVVLAGVAQPAMAQAADTGTSAWAPASIDHAQQMRVLEVGAQASQPTPPIIPKARLDRNARGLLGTFQPGGATTTADNAFFADLGTNGRTCLTCHQPQEGWSISAAGSKARFEASLGTDPLFRLIDGATCPTDKATTLQEKRQAYKLLTSKGLIRLGLAMPAPPSLQFFVASVADPYRCTTNPATGLRSPIAGIVSVYRRSLPSANVGFLTSIMWDGREPTLESQAVNATRIHAQSAFAPSVEARAEMVAFQKGIFTAQILDTEARELFIDQATGGPIALYLQLARFFPGVNDPFGSNPTKKPFDPTIFRLYTAWASLPAYASAAAGWQPAQSSSPETLERTSIARGEKVFNTAKFKITDVAGLNDVLKVASIDGFCGTCHDTPNVGNHSLPGRLMNIGVADAGTKSPPVLDPSGLPVFTLTCTRGPLAKQTFKVTDPGRALISGQCADIGKIKVPTLRGLAARAPYFHNGSAATLTNVVNFYDQRFSMGLTARQKADLVNFLNAL